jgi:hypothetical protein
MMRDLRYNLSRQSLESCQVSHLAMLPPMRGRCIVAGLIVALYAVVSLTACRRKEPAASPVATPTVTLNRNKAPLGSPIVITYKFVVANDAHFDQPYRVMLHVVDADTNLMWTDDHDPPVPTTQWKPGETVEYTRTVFVPVYPYVGEATLYVGLYSTATQKRLPLAGKDIGQRAYEVARLQLPPQTEDLSTSYEDGWNNLEVSEQNALVEWRWTKKQATLSFKNPRSDAIFYLDVDNPGGVFDETQRVQVTLGREVVDDFQVTPKHRLLRKILIKAAQLGTRDIAELQIAVDKTFVPTVVTAGARKDPRELGVRVFHAFIEPAR